MDKKTIVLADQDYKYLLPLELKFVQELYEQVELEVITDKAYFEQYFSSPKKAELLIISESWYSSELQRHDISHIFILAEKGFKAGTEDLSVHKVDKYTSIKEVFNEIIYISGKSLQNRESISKDTEVVLVYSPIGGSGKTTLALGLSACLANNHKKAVYMDAEYLHTFQHYLSSKAYITSEAYRAFKEKDGQIYQKIKQHLRNEGFDYLPPFSASLSSHNISFSSYKSLIQSVKATKDYEFIIVDTDSVFDDDKAELMTIADRVLMVVEQDEYSAFKIETLLKNVNYSNNEKYMFICNKFRPSEPNGILDGGMKGKILISEYVEQIESSGAYSIQQLVEVNGFQKLAYMLI